MTESITLPIRSLLLIIGIERIKYIGYNNLAQRAFIQTKKNCLPLEPVTREGYDYLLSTYRELGGERG